MEFVNSISTWKRFLKNNGYMLCQSIGEGGFGDVFSAISSNDGVRYAIKRLVSRKNIMDERSAVGEINALVELDHPYVICAKEVLLCERMACIVMELATQGNLEMVLQNSTLSDKSIVRTFRQISCAVEYCHSLNMAHRDINPSNVLVFDTGDVKIADFGLCFRCKDEKNGNELLCSDYLGQESYLAPEVKAEKPYQAIPADVWSLGCVLSYIVSKCRVLPDNDFAVNSNKVPVMLCPALIDEPSYVQQQPSENSRTFSGVFTDKCLSFVIELKRFIPSERPTTTQVLQKWVKLGDYLLK